MFSGAFSRFRRFAVELLRISPVPASIGASCETCRYWGRDRWLGMPEECRRNAPSLKVQNGLSRPDWPLTEHTDWCGEYEPR